MKFDIIWLRHFYFFLFFSDIQKNYYKYKIFAIYFLYQMLHLIPFVFYWLVCYMWIKYFIYIFNN